MLEGEGRPGAVSQQPLTRRRWLAVCHVLVGDPDAALGYLSRAVELGLYNHPYLAEVDLVLAGLRSHAEFQRVIGEAKQLHAEFA